MQALDVPGVRCLSQPLFAMQTSAAWGAVICWSHLLSFKCEELSRSKYKCFFSQVQRIWTNYKGDNQMPSKSQSHRFQTHQILVLWIFYQPFEQVRVADLLGILIKVICCYPVMTKVGLRDNLTAKAISFNFIL